MSEEKSTQPSNVRRLPKPEPITAERLTAAGLAESPGTLSEPPRDVLSELYAHKFRTELRAGRAILELPPVTYLVPGWVPNSSVGMLYAPSGAGKSFVAFTLAVELARGGSWDGHKLEAAPVLYIAAEAPSVLRDRVADWEQHTSSELPECFHWLTAAPQLADADQLEALLEIVRQVTPALIVIDTLALCTRGVNENDGREWGRIAAALDAIARASTRDTEHGLEWASVLAVHHTGKDPTKKDRGSSVMGGALDYKLEITGDVTQLCVSLEKDKSGPGGLRAHYRLELLERPLPSGKLTAGAFLSSQGAVLVPVSYAEVKRTREEQLLELLRTEYRDGATCKEIATELKVSAEATRKELVKMRERGLLEQEGRSTATRYKLAAHLRLASSTATAEPQELEPF